MLKKIGFLLFFSCFFGSLKAQTYTAKEILDYWQHDNQRAASKYKGIARYVEFGLPDSAKSEYIQIEKLIGKNPDPKLQLYLAASKLQTQSFNGAHSSPALLGQVNALLPLAAKVDSQFALAWFYRFVGRVSYAERDYENAIYYLKLSIDLHDQVGEKNYTAEVYSDIYYSLAKALYTVKDYRQSIYYSQLSLKNLYSQPVAQNGDFFIESYILIKDLMGSSYKKSKDYEKAIACYQSILNIIQKNHLKQDAYYQFWAGLTRGNIGQVELNRGNLQKADTAIQDGLRAAEEARDSANILEFKLNLAQIAYLQGKPSKALSLALHVKKDLNYFGKSLKVQLYQVLYQASQKLKKYEDAIRYLNIYKDLLLAEQRLSDNSQLKNVEVELNYKRLQKRESERNIKINHLLWIRNSLIIFVILLVLVGWLSYQNYYHKQRKKFSVMALENELKEQEVQSALNQITLFKQNITTNEKLIQELELKAEVQWRNREELPESLKDFNLITEEAWNKFRIDFMTAYPRFLPAIRTTYPNLTQAEERLVMLIFLQFNNEKIAHTLGISKESVGKSKRRLRANLGFQSNLSLEDYIITLV